MGSDAVIDLLLNRAHGETALEIFEHALDPHELTVVTPRPGGTRAGEIGSQQLAPFAAAYFSQLVTARGVGVRSGRLLQRLLVDPQISRCRQRRGVG